MYTYKCPIAAKNKQVHTQFIATFRQFYLQWQEGAMTLELMRQTYTELENWLVNHVLRADTQLRACVKEGKQAKQPVGMPC